MRAFVVVNPTARRFRDDPALVGRVRAECAGRAEVFVTPSLDDLGRACRELARDAADLVVLCGGDGTYMAGATALVSAFGPDGRLPAVALAPGGTVATVARNWGQRGGVVPVVRRVIAAAASGSLATVRRPTLRVTDPDGGGARVGFIFGTGLVASFFDVLYGSGGSDSLDAARIVARIFAESFWGGPLARRVLAPMPLRLEVDGRPLGPEAWSLVVASVVRDVGLRFLVTYRAGEDPGRVHLVASPLGPARLGPQAPLVLLGKRLRGTGHFDDLVGRLVVRFPPRAPGAFVLDGDVFRARAVAVEPGPPIDVVAV